MNVTFPPSSYQTVYMWLVCIIVSAYALLLLIIIYYVNLCTITTRFVI